MEKHFSLYDKTVPSDNRPTDKCPPPDPEEDQDDMRMSKEYMLYYRMTHPNDD
jgi:hypothetical protein